MPGIDTAPHLALTMAAAVVLGAASWRLVERPAARLLRPRPRPAAAPAARARAEPRAAAAPVV